MPDAAERFIAAATRRFADNPELQIAGGTLLAEAISLTPVLEEDTLENAAKCLEDPDQKGLGTHWKGVLYIAAIAATFICAFAAYSRWISLNPDLNVFGAIAGTKLGTKSGSPQGEKLAQGLTPEQRLFLLGDYSRPTESERWEALWQSDPENPAFYIDYAAAYVSEHKRLPPSFLATGEKIDSGNAWFPAYAAGLLAEQAVEKVPRTFENERIKIPSKYVAKDAVKLAEARTLLGQAARLRNFDTHQSSLLAKRVRLLPTRTNAFDNVPAITYVAGIRSPTLPLRSLAGLVNVECTRLVENKDETGIRDLISDWEDFMEIFLRSPDATLVDLLVKMATANATYRDLARAAGSLGMEVEERRMQTMAKRLESYRSERAKRVHEDISREASFFAALALPIIQKQTSSSPDLRARLKPGRLAEHEFAGSMFIVLLVLPTFLICCIFVALYRFRAGKLHRLLSQRLERLLGPSDWAWIMVLGVLLPITFHQVVSRLPWLGGREWSIMALKFITPAASFNCMVYLAITLPVAIARWRLAKRAGFIGIRWKSQWIAFGICILVVLAMTFSPPLLLPWKGSPLVPIIFLSIAVTWQVWVLTVIFRGLFSSSGNLLKRTMLSRAVLPAYAAAVLLSVVFFSIHFLLEKQWAAKDELMEISPEAPALSRYEYEVLQTTREEFLDIFTTAQ